MSMTDLGMSVICMQNATHVSDGYRHLLRAITLWKELYCRVLRRIWACRQPYIKPPGSLAYYPFSSSLLNSRQSKHDNDSADLFVIAPHLHRWQMSPTPHCATLASVWSVLLQINWSSNSTYDTVTPFVVALHRTFLRTGSRLTKLFTSCSYSCWP